MRREARRRAGAPARGEGGGGRQAVPAASSAAGPGGDRRPRAGAAGRGPRGRCRESGLRAALGALLPPSPEGRAALKRWVLRALVAANLLLGFNYLSWRYLASINWRAWYIALPLLAAETYSFLGALLFGLTVWRLRRRPPPGPPPPGATVDVFITCYNEPVELVRATVRAAAAIRHPHRTYVLDDGNSPAMRAMAAAEGAGYLVRSADWQGKERHAKAGNLNNALFQTDGEFLLILDADQIPFPEILDRTLGYFADPRVAFVQTPQWFYNVPRGDPFGCEGSLFYGPIQQGKDGWNAAFFCGSNAVLRREALMQLGLRRYVQELERRVRRALGAADGLLRKAEGPAAGALGERVAAALADLWLVVRDARRELRAGRPIQELTWRFQRRAELIAAELVLEEMARVRAELADLPGAEGGDLVLGVDGMLDDREALGGLVHRDMSPLAAIASVRALLLAVDVDRQEEAQPVMPLATISVTEDMATAMRLHGMGWASVYHHEVLACGLAPDDLRSALQQRLRWAQGTVQVMLRENPLGVPGLSVGQRLMYVATMWSYLSGFFGVVYLAAPLLYLVFGLAPVRAFSGDFFWHLLPYLAVNQILFTVVGWGLPTWRGQQYSLALFPLWIKAVTSAVGNVLLGRKLGFVVTPKTRQGGVHLGLVRGQIAAMLLLVVAIVGGLARLAFGLASDGVPILINVAWACYDLVTLSAVLDAATYRPEEEAGAAEGAAATEPSDMLAAAGCGRR